MRLLWQRYGRDFYHGKARGIEEADVEALFAEATGADLRKLFRDGVHGTRDLPLPMLLVPFGVAMAPAVSTVGAAGKPSLGARVRGGAECVLASLHENGAAQKAGLSAGDVLVAIDGLRVTSSNLESLLSRYLPGTRIDVHAFRRDELRVARVKLDGPEVSNYTLSIADGPGPSKQWRERWLKA
jgi:predicted metalloprotease with PDZ domain